MGRVNGLQRAAPGVRGGADAGFFESGHLAAPFAEAALGQPPIQRHLTAFKAFDRNTGSRLLTLHAPPGSLADTGTDAAANAHFALRCSSVFLNIV